MYQIKKLKFKFFKSIHLYTKEMKNKLEILLSLVYYIFYIIYDDDDERRILYLRVH